MTNGSYKTIEDRVAKIKDNMAEAAIRSGRKPEEITLVGAVKTQSPDSVRQMIEAGVDVVGESRVQELVDREQFLTGLPHETHYIGRLQRNKTKFLPGRIQMIQSLGSLRMLKSLEKHFADEPNKLNVLIQVNIGDESSKSGILPKELPAFAERVIESPNLRLCGLMTIPPFLEGEAIRPYFQQMYQLFVDIKAKKLDNSTVNTLSMGMSSDYEIAIEEGATMVRVGTSLFGRR